MNHRAKLLCVLLVFAVLLSGCWDSIPVEDRNFVTAVGIDYHSEPPHYLVTFVAPIVDEAQSAPTRIQSIRSTSLAEAFAIASHTDANTYSYGKLLVLLLGEEAARQGISAVLNDLFKHTDLRTQSYVAVTLGTSHELLTTVPPEGQRAGLFIKGMLDRAQMQRDIPPTTLEIFTNRMMTPGMDASTTLLTPIGSMDPRPPDERGGDGGGAGSGTDGQQGGSEGTPAEDIQIAGKAIWQGDKLVGTMSLQQLQYLSFAQGTAHSLLIQMLLKPDDRFVPETSRLMVLVEKPKPTWETQIIDGIPHFNLKVRTVVDLINYQGTVELTESDNADELEKKLTEAIAQGVMDSLLAVSALGSDPIGLGQFVRIQYPKFWDSKMWTEVIKTARFSVDVKLVIKNIGIDITRFEPKDKRLFRHTGRDHIHRTSRQNIRKPARGKNSYPCRWVPRSSGATHGI